jgi:hypothetical protein
LRSSSEGAGGASVVAAPQKGQKGNSPGCSLPQLAHGFTGGAYAWASAILPWVSAWVSHATG